MYVSDFIADPYCMVEPMALQEMENKAQRHFKMWGTSKFVDVMTGERKAWHEYELAVTWLKFAMATTDMNQRDGLVAQLRTRTIPAMLAEAERHGVTDVSKKRLMAAVNSLTADIRDYEIRNGLVRRPADVTVSHDEMSQTSRVTLVKPDGRFEVVMTYGADGVQVTVTKIEEIENTIVTTPVTKPVAVAVESVAVVEPTYAAADLMAMVKPLSETVVKTKTTSVSVPAVEIIPAPIPAVVEPTPTPVKTRKPRARGDTNVSFSDACIKIGSAIDFLYESWTEMGAVGEFKFRIEIIKQSSGVDAVVLRSGSGRRSKTTGQTYDRQTRYLGAYADFYVALLAVGYGHNDNYLHECPYMGQRMIAWLDAHNPTRGGD